MGTAKIIIKTVLGIPMKIACKVKPVKYFGDWVLKPFPKLRGRIKSYLSTPAIINPANNIVSSKFAEPEEEKYIPKILRVSSMVEKDANINTIFEILLKTRNEYEKRKKLENKPEALFDAEMEKIKNEYYSK